ncbi:transmembrane protease serine 6 [Ambystoma mexicanum]|uniref:transmembrane protease serine 6 n=1 Tax=Ambystoma mexicanum TaxID=8296 RepID=UPI0037E881AC
MDPSTGSREKIATNGVYVHEGDKKKTRDLLRFAPIWIVLLLAGAGVLTWYFLEYHFAPSSRVSQRFACSLRILNRQLTQDLSRQDTKAFKVEAGKVQKMVGDLVRATELAPLFNSSTVYAFGQGSLTAFFWIQLLMTESQLKEVTQKTVNSTLSSALHASANGTGTFHSAEYSIDPYSLVTVEMSEKDQSILVLSLGCYRYSYLREGEVTSLKGPDYLFTRCLWHIQAPRGHMVKLRLQWKRTDCRDRLAMYDSPAPLESHLITSHYGCSRQEPVVEVLSSDQAMSVLWKQAMYSYYDPFDLSAQAVPLKACEENLELKPGLDIQGSIRTPHYPSYYSPATNCSWHITVPSTDYGVVLWFDAYFLERHINDKPCTQGQWLIQNHRMCGLRVLLPYAERITMVSTSTTVSFSSQITLTGPGLQVSYSLYNQTDPCPGEFLCSVNGLCVPACDGVKDCPNELDERNCICPAQFECPEDSTCLSYDRVCDGHRDCTNGSDEAQCQGGVPCGPYTYRCQDGICLKKPNPECDSMADCADLSDERDCDCGFQASTGRIVGGTASIEGEWPWQASLQIQGYHFCGATLVSQQWLVSAAHCFSLDSLASPSLWTVYLGKYRLNPSSKNEMSFKVSQIILHPFYDEDTHDFDVALIQMDHPLIGPTFIKPICLPTSTHFFRADAKCWATGWGAEKESGPPINVLQKVDVPLVPQDACMQAYRYQISPRMLCAGYQEGKKDACQGDSGGPLACKEPSGRWFLAGVVSWGSSCGAAKYYGVYTRVTRIVHWIKQVIS